MNSITLRDAVHGDIYLTRQETDLLDTVAMQRLRGIRQLGTAFYVYPTAQHSRFEHCLGACWMARCIVRRVESEGGFPLPEVEKHAVCLAALVHDVTHIPFGHTFEDERRLLERHDLSRSRYDRLIAGGELGEKLRASEAGRLALKALAPDPEPAHTYLRDIVSGTICADLLDYLKRDNYFCGLSYRFDERIFHYFRVVDGRLTLALHKGGLLRRDALTEITNLLRIRYVLSERVYYHHAKIASGVMVSKAVERALNCGLTEERLCRLTDDALIHYLREHFAEDKPLTELLGDFCSRRLFKRCYMVSRSVGEEAVASLVRSYHLNEGGDRDAAEEQIARSLGVPAHRIAVYCAPPGMALKEADVPVTMPAGDIQKLSSLNSAEIRILKDQHRALWKLYVFASAHLEADLMRAGQVCEEVIGFPNELPAERAGNML